MSNGKKWENNEARFRAVGSFMNKFLRVLRKPAVHYYSFRLEFMFTIIHTAIRACSGACIAFGGECKSVIPQSSCSQIYNLFSAFLNILLYHL